MVVEGTSVDCDLALVVHCASLVTRSEYVLLVLHSQAFHRSLGMRLHYIMKPQEKQFFFFFSYYTSHTFTFRVMETLSSRKAFTKVSFLQDVMCLHA